jgi:hypothetical protein
LKKINIDKIKADDLAYQFEENEIESDLQIDQVLKSTSLIDK